MSADVTTTAGVPRRIEPLTALDLAQTAAAAVIAKLDDRHWQLPTPCDEWTVRDIVNKMTASTIVFTAFGERRRPEPAYDLVHPAEIIGADPLGAFQSAAADCRRVWRGEDALEGTAPSTVGEYPAKAVLNARIFDTTILTWDVATAIGVDPGITDELAGYVLRVAKALVGNVRAVSPERYKDPADSPDQPLLQQMIAATGRDPLWEATTGVS